MTKEENSAEVKVSQLTIQLKEYTKEELIKAIRPTEEINKKYATFDENTKSWKLDINNNNNKNLNQFPAFCEDENDKKDEKWLPYPAEPNIKVSNLGRIKIDGGIAELVDVKDCDGYLYIKEYKKYRKEDKIKLYDVDWVYQMVAETWLVKEMEGQKDFLGPWEVHHISNDGYDNSVKNLIWLKKQLHMEIHNEARKNGIN